MTFDANGLVPAIAQDAKTGAVLMLAWMNADSLKRTLASGDMVYWSRSRTKLWRKGETSGHTQRVVEAFIDCDGDTLLLKVDQVGPACHTGAPACFFRRVKQSSNSRSSEILASTHRLAFAAARAGTACL